MFGLGTVIMIAADAQKYFVLKVRRGLITDGMFRYVRHPNYLGEMMLYGGFGVIVNDYRFYAILLYVWLLLFSANMAHKEARMSRYDGWAAYVAQSGLLLPPVSTLSLLLPGSSTADADAGANAASDKKK